MTFLCMIALKNKTLAHTYLPSFDNASCSATVLNKYFFLEEFSSLFCFVDFCDQYGCNFLK